MSTDIVIVVIGGSLLGYWCVSSLMTALSKGSEPRHQNKPDSYGSENWHTADQQEHNAHRPPDVHSVAPWYKTLGVSESATLEEAAQAYKHLIRKYHPDKVSTLGREFQLMAEEKSRQINAAYAQVRELRRKQ